MLQANKPILRSDTSRALLIKNDHTYTLENYTGKDFDLYFFFKGDIGSADGVSAWLGIMDGSTDNTAPGNASMLIRKGNNVYIKIFLDSDDCEIEETDICMPVDAARKLFVQIERLLVELPERAEIIWHEDGSATLEWQTTSIRQVAVECIEDRYCVVDQTNAQVEDCLLVEFLNSFLDLLRADDKVTIAWLYNPMSKSITIGSLTILNKMFNWVEGSIILKNKKIRGSSVAFSYYFFRLLCEHATRISNEKPSQIALKWYKHTAAFEWERDCDTTRG